MSPKQARGAETEEVRVEPRVAELFLDQNEIGERLFGLGDAARGLEADALAGALFELADHAHHHQRNGQVGVDRFHAGRCFDEVGARHHAGERRFGDVGHVAEFAGGDDRLHVRRSAGFAELLHLFVDGAENRPRAHGDAR